MSAILAAANTESRWEIYHATADWAETILSRYFPGTGTTLPVEAFEAHLVKHYTERGSIEGDVQALVHDALLGSINALIENKSIKLVSGTSYNSDSLVLLGGGVHNNAFDECKQAGVAISDTFFD